MGRKAKYATQEKYQPYIDSIMKDLGLEGKVFIDWTFGGPWAKKGGDAYLSDNRMINNMRYGKITIDETCSHAWILKAIAHELRHIYQRLNGMLSGAYLKHIKTKRGTSKLVWMQQWNGVETRFYTWSPRNKMQAQLYAASPWEIDAREYEKEVARLFPNNRLPPINNRSVVGSVTGTGNRKITFYKTAIIIRKTSYERNRDND